MRIGIVSKFGEKDGIAIYSDNLAAALRKKGAHVVTIGDKNSSADYRINLKSFFLKQQLERITKKEKLQAIHIQYIAERSYYGLHTLNLNLVNALSQRVPVAVTMHEVHYNAAGLKNAIVKRLEKSVIKKAGAIIVHTKGQKSFIEKEYGRRNAHAIPMGVSLHKMHRKKGRTILFFGMLSEAKGVEYLIDAMNMLKGYSLRIAGRPVSMPYIEKLAIHMKRCRNKSIKADFGWVSDGKKHEYFENSDILALPYTSAQYQSAVLHDAISYGLPAIATKTGPISEIVSEFNCGEVIEARNSNAIAEAIKKVEKNYKKYQRGIMKYRKEANWEKSAEKHIKVYEELTG